MTRELHVGEEVLGRDGHPLGQVERLVVDEAAHRVTHVVVAGRLVGVQRLRESDGALVVDVSRGDFQKFPKTEHDHLGAPGDHWSAPLGYTLENFLAIAGSLIGQSPYVPPVHFDPELEDVHEITQGSPVWSGRRRVGTVERVLTDGGSGTSPTSQPGSVTELVVRREGILGHHVRLPVARVQEVVGNNVHVDLSEADEENLPDYSD